MFNRFFKDVKKYYKYVIFAGQTELNSEVANSYLNWLWWIIEPLCFMFIYSFVFGIMFGNSEPNFNIFIYIGITMWDFFQRMLTASVKLVKSNKAIVSKVYIPKFMLILVKMYVNAFKMLVCFGILALMIIVERVPFTPYMLLFIPIVLVEMILTFGICTILLNFGVYVEDLANVTQIVLRMLFYMTGVFYNLDRKMGATFGNTAAYLVKNLNPVASIIISMRSALLYGQLPNYKTLIAWTIVGFILSVLGVRLIYKNENNYVKVI